MTQTTQMLATQPGTLSYLAIPAEELDAIRMAGRDEAGNVLEIQVPAEGGAPLRCCLREARAGERLLLIAYTPPGTAGAYAERGPVFIHAEHCDGYWTCDAYDPGHQECTAHDARPPLCRGFPWYGDGPSAERAGRVHRECSYLADLPPGDRPEGSRPLIPLTVL